VKSAHKRFSPEWWAWMTMPEPNSGCLLWLGCVCKNGYGRIGYGSGGSAVLVHRIAYESAFGPFDRSRHVCHSCDTPSCVNPDHLFIGTQRDNMRDMFEKGRGNPGGLKPRRVRLLTTVAPLELAIVNSNASVRIVEDIHHIRTTPIVAGWRHVTGVPARRPTQAMTLYECPDNRTPKPSSAVAPGYESGATVAPCCGFRAPQERDGEVSR
jgi:hypothetical protein